MCGPGARSVLGVHGPVGEYHKIVGRPGYIGHRLRVVTVDVRCAVAPRVKLVGQDGILLHPYPSGAGNKGFDTEDAPVVGIHDKQPLIVLGIYIP